MDRASFITHEAFEGEISDVLIPRERIVSRLDELAAEIAACYAGKELTALAVMTGAMVFLSDLIRRLPLRVRLDVVRASSYPSRAQRSESVSVIGPVAFDLAGRDVLIVDDILDSGKTLRAIASCAAGARAASVRTCVLLRKRRDDLAERPRADFVGFDIDDHFVVGYGLDHDNLYRNLPDICLLRGPGGGQRA